MWYSIPFVAIQGRADGRHGPLRQALPVGPYLGADRGGTVYHSHLTQVNSA